MYTKDYCKTVRKKINNRLIHFRHIDLMYNTCNRKMRRRIVFHQLKGFLDGLFDFNVIDIRMYNHYYYYISHCKWLDWS